MKLKDILMESLKDFDDSPLPGMDNARVLYLPNTNFVISVFNEEKKLLFIPNKHSFLPNKIQDFIYSLEEYFNISEVNIKDDNVIEVSIDPRQDFNKVLLYIQEEMGVDEEL